MKAPKRFIGYAFSVGDLLLEVNEQFKILNADGAVNSLFGDEEQAIVGSNFLDYLTDTDRSTIELSATRLTGKNRVGPLQVKMRAAKNVYKEFAVFISQLPFNDNVMYVVVSRAYRLGFDSKVAKNKGFEDEKNKDDFIGQLTDIFDGNEEAEKNLLVTVFDSQQDGVSPENEANLERYLASVSLGGAHAA